MKNTITYLNIVSKILKKLDMAMFGVKYLKKWTTVFCEIGVVFLLSRLLYITEGKYKNELKKFRKFRKFRDVLSSASHETGGTAKKVTASESAKPGPHIHIFFFSQGSRVSVCVCVCVMLFCWRLFHLISPRSNLVWCLLYMEH